MFREEFIRQMKSNSITMVYKQAGQILSEYQTLYLMKFDLIFVFIVLQ